MMSLSWQYFKAPASWQVQFKTRDLAKGFPFRLIMYWRRSPSEQNSIARCRCPFSVQCSKYLNCLCKSAICMSLRNNANFFEIEQDSCLFLCFHLFSCIQMRNWSLFYCILSFGCSKFLSFDQIARLSLCRIITLFFKS